MTHATQTTGDSAANAVQHEQLLTYLTQAIAACNGIPAADAWTEARRIYATAQLNYITIGAAIYGETHAGLMLWVMEQLEQPMHPADPPEIEIQTTAIVLAEP